MTAVKTTQRLVFEAVRDVLSVDVLKHGTNLKTDLHMMHSDRASICRKIMATTGVAITPQVWDRVETYGDLLEVVGC